MISFAAMKAESIAGMYAALEATRMSTFHSKMTSFIVMSVAVILPSFSLAQSQTAPTQSDQPSRVSIVYAPPQNSAFQQLYMQVISAFGGKAETLGLTSKRQVRSGNMELEKTRARRSISNTQSVLIVKAEI